MDITILSKINSFKLLHDRVFVKLATFLSVPILNVVLELLHAELAVAILIYPRENSIALINLED